MARVHDVDYRHRRAIFGPPSRSLELGISDHGGDLALAVGGSVSHSRMHPGRHSASADGYWQGAMAALHCKILVPSARGDLFPVPGDPHRSGFSLLSGHAKWCVLGCSVDVVFTSSFLKCYHVFIVFCGIRALPIRSGVFPAGGGVVKYDCLLKIEYPGGGPKRGHFPSPPL